MSRAGLQGVTITGGIPARSDHRPGQLVYPIGLQHLSFGQHIPHPSINVIPTVGNFRSAELHGQTDHIGRSTNLGPIELISDELFRGAFIDLATDTGLLPAGTAYVIREIADQIIYLSFRPFVALDHELKQFVIAGE